MIHTFQNRRIMAALSTNGGAVVPWYLSGGIPAANCLAAYQPKGAASLAASYDNLAAPGNGLADGTYDCTLGVAPTWDAVSGWNFIGAYLNTSIINAVTPVWSFALRYTTSDVVSFGTMESAGIYFGLEYGSGGKVYYENGFWAYSSPIGTSGVLAVTGLNGYLNGILDKTIATSWSGTIPHEIYIGGQNRDGSIRTTYHEVQAVSIYNISITPTQV
jgi:hypothetical protein